MNDRPIASRHDEQDTIDHDRDMFVAKLTRRGALGALAAVGFGLLAACGEDDASAGTNNAATTTPGTTARPTTTTTAASTVATSATTAPAGTTTTAPTGDYLDFPEETSGPFPADGSNSNGSGSPANVLTDARIVRSDVTTNLDGTQQQPGIPMALTMTLGSGGTPLAGAAVYVWHCSRDGHYSVYSGG